MDEIRTERGREYLERTREKEDWQIDVLFTRRKKKGEVEEEKSIERNG